MTIFKVIRQGQGSGEYVGRPSPLGNPYYMSNESARDYVCDKYDKWFTHKVQEKDAVVMAELRRLWRLGRKGHVNLVCHCAPKRCHADTVAKFLNSFDK